MFSRWTQHLNTEEEKEAFKKEIYSAKRVLERVQLMIEEDIEQLDHSEENQRVYSLPNWDYLQAHKNGNRQAYNTLWRLVNLDQQKGSINDHKSTG